MLPFTLPVADVDMQARSYEARGFACPVRVCRLPDPNPHWRLWLERTICLVPRQVASLRMRRLAACMWYNKHHIDGDHEDERYNRWPKSVAPSTPL